MLSGQVVNELPANANTRMQRRIRLIPDLAEQFGMLGYRGIRHSAARPGNDRKMS